MQIFDSIDHLRIDRRDAQLWTLVIAMVVILATGFALLMYPSISVAPPPLMSVNFRVVFCGFCVLNVLFVLYVVDRRATIRRLRRRLIEEHQRNAELRTKSSKDALASLPNLDHFRDRLTMEFRRAMHCRESLSLLVVDLNFSARLCSSEEITNACGDAAKALLLKLRTEDSIYLIRQSTLALLLPKTGTADAGGVADRMAAVLDEAAATGRFSFGIEIVSYPDNASTAREMEMRAVSYSHGVANEPVRRSYGQKAQPPTF